MVLDKEHIETKLVLRSSFCFKIFLHIDPVILLDLTTCHSALPAVVSCTHLACNPVRYGTGPAGMVEAGEVDSLDVKVNMWWMVKGCTVYLLIVHWWAGHNYTVTRQYTIDKSTECSSSMQLL